MRLEAVGYTSYYYYICDYYVAQ